MVFFKKSYDLLKKKWRNVQFKVEKWYYRHFFFTKMENSFSVKAKLKAFGKRANFLKNDEKHD